MREMWCPRISGHGVHRAVKSRSTSGILRRTLIMATAPTIAAPMAPSLPSSTTAASVAAELGDHAHWRSPEHDRVESHTRKEQGEGSAGYPELQGSAGLKRCLSENGGCCRYDCRDI